MKLDNFQCLVLYLFLCCLPSQFRFLTGYVLLCIRNKEIKGDVMEEIAYYEKTNT